MVDRLSRVRFAEPLELYAKGFRRALDEQGYAPSSALAQLRLVAHLSRWMAREETSPGELRSSPLTWCKSDPASTIWVVTGVNLGVFLARARKGEHAGDLHRF